MKKFFLMLAVALPMLFAVTACGDDDDPDWIDGNTTIPYKMPLLTKDANGVLQITNNSISLGWGETQSDVKAAMNPFSYVLSTRSNSLVYTYDADGSMPIYVYSFATDKLASSSITISEEMDDQVDFMTYFKNQDYKDVTEEDEDDIVFRSKDKLTVVHYGYDGDITVLWMPNDGTRANDWRAVLNQHLETVASINK